MTFRDLCTKISTCGPVGQWRGGSFIASLLALPLLLSAQMFRWLSPYYYHVFLLIAVFAILAAIHFTLTSLSDRDPSIIVIDKTVGFMIAMCCIPFSIKLILVGFIFFHLTNIMLPVMLARFWDVHLENLPTALSIVSGDILSGIVVQITLQILLWIAR